MMSDGTLSVDEVVRELQDKLRRFTEYAYAQRRLEADMLESEGPWFDDMPEEIYDTMMEVQVLRNKALGI